MSMSLICKRSLDPTHLWVTKHRLCCLNWNWSPIAIYVLNLGEWSVRGWCESRHRLSDVISFILPDVTPTQVVDCRGPKLLGLHFSAFRIFRRTTSSNFQFNYCSFFRAVSKVSCVHSRPCIAVRASPCQRYHQ